LSWLVQRGCHTLIPSTFHTIFNIHHHIDRMPNSCLQYVSILHVNMQSYEVLVI
jgi:hypothetical protein